MHPLTPLDHLLALTLAIFFPIRSASFGYRRLAQAAERDVPRVRGSLYTQSMLIEWSLSAIVLALWFARARPWGSLGLTWRTNAWSIGLVAAFAILVTMIATRLPRVLADAATLTRVRGRLDHIERLLPVSEHEMWRFYLLSFTAGVCEELLYRGYLLDYLRHFVPWPFAVAIAVLAFAIGHSYQGPRGILTTGIAGAVFMALYIGTGSLYLPMVAHALLDAYSGTLGRRAFAAANDGDTGALAVAAGEGPGPAGGAL